MVTGAARCDPECGASGPRVKGAPLRYASAPPIPLRSTLDSRPSTAS